MSLFDSERKNFYRASILVFKYGTEALTKTLERHCETTWTAFIDFIQKHRHSIFHMVQKDGCCKCMAVKVPFYPGYLLRSHWYDIFHLLGPRYICPHHPAARFKVCSCDNAIRRGILPRSLDIIIVGTLLLNIQEFTFEPEVQQAILDIRRLRNEVLAKGKTGRMKENDYIIISRQLQNAIGILTEEISSSFHKEISQQVTQLLTCEIHLHTLMDVVSVMIHAVDREIKLLHDIQNLSTSVYEGRQGEITSMVEYVSELVVACYGQADPLLKELQSIKFLLVDGKYKDVINRMDGQMNKLLRSQRQSETTLKALLSKLRKKDLIALSNTPELQLVPCGENLQLSGNCRSVTWHQIYSGGVIFSHRPLSKLELISLRMVGSGNVAMGIIQSDPRNLHRNLGKLFQENELTIGINVKLLDSNRDVSIRMGGDIDGDKVFLVSEKEKYTVTKKPGLPTWLVVYIRFGDVRVELVPDSGKVLRFCETIGHNIQLIEGNKRMAKLIEENISAACRLSRRLYCGEEVTFHVRPIKHKDTLPNMFSVDLGITTEGTQNGSFHDDNPFTAASRTWAIKTYFDNQNCLGKIHISVSLSGLVSMTNAKGTCGNAHLTKEDRRFGVAVIFQLYRCNLEIVGYKIKEN